MSPNAKKEAETHETGAESEQVQVPGPDILEPHSSLRYVGTMFKVLAALLALIIIAEIGIGLWQDGIQALPLLLLEIAQLLVFAGLLWGGGDIAYLLLETNHDVRAGRVLLWQLNMLQKMELDGSGRSVDLIDPEHPLPEEEEERGVGG